MASSPLHAGADISCTILGQANLVPLLVPPYIKNGSNQSQWVERSNLHGKGMNSEADLALW